MTDIHAAAQALLEECRLTFDAPASTHVVMMEREKLLARLEGVLREREEARTWVDTQRQVAIDALSECNRSIVFTAVGQYAGEERARELMQVVQDALHTLRQVVCVKG